MSNQRVTKDWRREHIYGRIVGTPRLREWQLRLFYKRLHAEHPHIVMHRCKGGLLALRNVTTERVIYLRNMEEWEAQREWFMQPGKGPAGEE